MDESERKAWSKYLSYLLRHEPQAVGLELDQAGWVAIDELLRKCQAHGKALSRAMLEEVVATSPKRRFAISEDRLRIRASQGHSLDVDLGYQPAVPPETLYHGTVAATVEAIRAGGLQKMQRHHVHLSADAATARTVGARRGKPVVLRIAALRMHAAGHPFFRSENGVWLTDWVPPDYIELP